MASRRQFLRTSLAFGGFGLAAHLTRFGLLNAAAASAGDYRALVCVFLFGGNDANNMVIPTDARYAEYQKIRATLALGQDTLHAFALPGSAETYGFHPALGDYQTLYNNKELAVVANVGSLVKPTSRSQYTGHLVDLPGNLFSHSDQQMQWQTSVLNGPARTGWAGRAADEVAYLNGGASFPTVVSVAGNAIFGTGERTRPGTFVPNAALGLRGFDKSAASAARMTALENLLNQELVKGNSGATLIQAASQTMSDGLKDNSDLEKAIAGNTLKTVFPTTSIGAQLQEVARIIQVHQQLGMNRQIFFCSLGGFDTHTNELADQARLFGQLGPAVAAFQDAMRTELQMDKNVTLFTESDFSRTFQPNSNGGTDHAWGSHHIVAGGAVQGGNIYGRFPVISLGSNDDSGTEGRWIPTTSIDQYGATLASWFGVPDNRLDAVFPNLNNFNNQKLTFLG